jgi:hypothetical protein
LASNFNIGPYSAVSVKPILPLIICFIAVSTVLQVQNTNIMRNNMSRSEKLNLLALMTWQERGGAVSRLLGVPTVPLTTQDRVYKHHLLVLIRNSSRLVFFDHFHEVIVIDLLNLVLLVLFRVSFVVTVVVLRGGRRHWRLSGGDLLLLSHWTACLLRGNGRRSLTGSLIQPVPFLFTR